MAAHTYTSESIHSRDIYAVALIMGLAPENWCFNIKKVARGLS